LCRVSAVSVAGGQWVRGTRMKPSPSYIHFRMGWQLLGPESPGQWFGKEQFRTFWDRLNDSGPLTSGYHDFSYRPNRCELAELRGQREDGRTAFSKISCQPDELTVVEEWAELTADEFAEKFTAVLKVWFEVFPQTFFVVQTSTLRTLVQPTNFNDSRIFLGDRVLNLGPKVHDTFTDMPFKIGFGASCMKKVHDQELFIDATVTSWRDNRLVWTEVQGTAPLAAPLNAGHIEPARLLFTSCRTFLEGELLALLTSYDIPGSSKANT